ncbi:hypothetical protein JCM3774_005273 [Rhodotorula dairenensis]
MFASTFVTGCSAVLSLLEALVTPAQSPSAPSPATHDFYRHSTRSPQRPAVPQRLPAAAAAAAEEETVSPALPSSPSDSDSSSLSSQSSSDLFDSSSDASSSDNEDDACRSRSFAVKLACLDSWLSGSDLPSSDRALARAFGLKRIESEEAYEIRYEQSRQCVKTSKFVESDAARDERSTDRLSRALDDFAAQRRTAAQYARLREVQRSLPLTFVARPYSWSAQSHSRLLPFPATSTSPSPSPATDLRAIRAVVQLSPARRVSQPAKSSTRSTGKSITLLRKTLDCGVGPVYRAYKIQRQQARAAARLASVSRPAAGCTLSSVVYPEVKRRGPPRKVASVNLATGGGLENASTRSKIPVPIGLGRPSTATVPSRLPMPLATRNNATAPLRAPAPPATLVARRPRKSYGDIQPRRPAFRV